MLSSHIHIGWCGSSQKVEKWLEIEIDYHSAYNQFLIFLLIQVSLKIGSIIQEAKRMIYFIFIYTSIEQQRQISDCTIDRGWEVSCGCISLPELHEHYDVCEGQSWQWCSSWEVHVKHVQGSKGARLRKLVNQHLQVDALPNRHHLCLSQIQTCVFCWVSLWVSITSGRWNGANLMVINLVLFWFMLLFAGFLALWTTAIVRCRHVARHHHRPEDKTQEHTALHFKKLHFVTFQAGQNTLRKIYFTLVWTWKSIIAPSWSRKPHDLLVGSFIFASSQNMRHF